MKKLESLKKDKFEGFKEFELADAVKIIGGTPVATCMNGKDDYYDYATNDTHTTDGAGTPRDFYMKSLSISAG